MKGSKKWRLNLGFEAWEIGAPTALMLLLTEDVKAVETGEWDDTTSFVLATFSLRCTYRHPVWWQKAGSWIIKSEIQS